jgi:uncharacterized membrane protein YccF (DUF307 family)
MAQDDPGLVVRTAWFLLVGWWLTGIWLAVAWALNVTIIGLPLGIWMINQTPLVFSLKAREPVVADKGGREQHNLLVRVVWFVFVGWWASGIWVFVAYLFQVSIVGIPLAVVMYNHLPYVVSLYRY